MTSVVKPYKRLYSKIVSVNNIDYTPSTIPDEFIIVHNILTPEVEQKLLRLIKSGLTEDKKELEQILSCIAKEFEPEVKCKLNSRTVSMLKPGDEWREVQDLKYFNPCVININMGSHTNIVCRNKKTRQTTSFLLPARSMYLYRDSGDLYERSTDRKTSDWIDGEQVSRGTRYSIVFKSKK